MGMYILCPYFKRERKKSITCEDTIRSYPTLKDKRDILNDYCASEWKRCPFASALEHIYNHTPENQLKEKIMENKIKQMEAEINRLMRENGQLQKKNEVLQQQIKDRDHIAEKNHKMYMKQIKNKEALLLAKDKQIEWLESFAAAFLIVAYGEDVREIKMSQDKILKLMTEYKLEMKHDPETGDWIFNVSVSEKEKKS